MAQQPTFCTHHLFIAVNKSHSRHSCSSRHKGTQIHGKKWSKTEWILHYHDGSVVANVQNLQYLKMLKDYNLWRQKQIQKYNRRLSTYLSHARISRWMSVDWEIGSKCVETGLRGNRWGQAYVIGQRCLVGKQGSTCEQISTQILLKKEGKHFKVTNLNDPTYL